MFNQTERGFSLIEAIVSLVVLGIIGATVGLFITLPVQGAADLANRAHLTDAADAAIREIDRNLRSALPNSLRITSVGSVVYLEYLQLRTEGRYRSVTSGGAVTASSCPDTNGNTLDDEDALNFSAADTCFRSIGDVANLATIVPGTDYLVLQNLGTGFAGKNAYEFAGTGGNKTLISAAAATSGNENRITFASHTFPFAAPGSRFHVISGPVTYVCDPVSGQLRRQSGYAISVAQVAPPAGATANVLVAGNISACGFVYAATATESGGVLSTSLTLTRNNESITLQYGTSINNVP